MSKSVKLSSRPAFARHFPSDQHRAVVSTYLLDSNTDSRSGSLCILNASEDYQDLALESEIPTSAGVFRFEWRTPSSLVAALTDGNLVVQKVEDSKSSDSTQVSSDMLLDVGLSDSSLTVTSDNKGFAYVVDLNTNLIVSSWLAHSLPFMNNQGCEVWSCQIDKTASIVITGGEDSTMKLWDARTRTSIGQCKSFEGGVVFVDFHDDGTDEKLITGSYDERIRILDRRNLKNPLVEKKMPGGVWNIEKNQSNYCVSCMYGGYAILDETLEIVKQNLEAGTNLLYGATTLGDKILYCTFNDYLVVLDQ